MFGLDDVAMTRCIRMDSIKACTVISEYKQNSDVESQSW